MGTVGRVIGISLLTLVPGISGGSETYARELVRALGRVGELDYRVFLPPIAPDVDGLPAGVVPGHRAPVAPRDHDLRARRRHDPRTPRGAADEAAADPPRHRPRAVPPGSRGARGLPALSRAAVAAQESRAAVRGDDAAPWAEARAD